jgi:hypothetical protein
MAIKYLDAKRLQGTNAERLALTSAGLGSAVDGTNQGTTTTSNTPIYNQTSVNFSGSQYAKDFGTTSTFATLTQEDFTIAFWLRVSAEQDNSGNFGVLIQNGKTSNVDNGLTIGLDDDNTGKFYLNVRGGANNKTAFDDVFTNDLVPEDTYWHHYVFRFDNTNEELTIFKDGDNTATQTLAYGEQLSDNASTTSEETWIGAEQDGIDRFFEGDMADVGIWKRLLTFGASSEVSDLYNTMTSSLTTATEGATGAGIETLSNTTGLLAHWKCNDANWTNSATPVYPNLPNGTIFNETDAYKYFMFDGTDTWNQMVSS